MHFSRIVIWYRSYVRWHVVASSLLLLLRYLPINFNYSHIRCSDCIVKSPVCSTSIEVGDDLLAISQTKLAESFQFSCLNLLFEYLKRTKDCLKACYVYTIHSPAGCPSLNNLFMPQPPRLASLDCQEVQSIDEGIVYR